MKNADAGDIVDAIRDLTNVLIVIQGDFGSRAEVIRELGQVIPPTRLGAILGVPPKDVTSVLSRARKKKRGAARG